MGGTIYLTEDPPKLFQAQDISLLAILLSDHTRKDILKGTNGSEAPISHWKSMGVEDITAISTFENLPLSGKGFQVICHS